ncbi:unnamed protein product [Rhodiola kirilowii]
MAEHCGRRYGVRKGAWSEQEDALLRECIDKYGEGKWHQVPLKAGLNRCRKSCRLRWLNYLRPNIKRGEFSIDEADLMIRLHKLLGNRWSLIAGRLPGRTANDVKNYWNTHLRKKTMLHLQVNNHRPRTNFAADHQTEVIRPRPRTFSKSLVQCIRQQHQGQQPIFSERKNTGVSKKREQLDNSSALVSSTENIEEQIQWWKSLLNDQTDQFELASGFYNGVAEQGYEIARATDNSGGAEERPTGPGELSLDIELWDFLTEEW